MPIGHMTFTIPEVQELLQRHGMRYSEVRSPDKGKSSRVFQLHNGQGVEYVKFNIPPRIKALAAVHKVLAQRKIPSPRVMFSTQDKTDPPCFLILSEVKGVDLGDLPLTVRLRYLAEAADILARTHEIPVTGYGPLIARNGQIMGKHASWSEYLALKAPDIDALVAASIVNERDANIYRSVAERIFTAPARPARLLHNDFHRENILVDQGVVSGVIDWDNAIAGDPLYDLANVWHVFGEHFDRFMAGYRADVDVARFNDLRIFRSFVKIGEASKVRRVRLEKYLERLEELRAELDW